MLDNPYVLIAALGTVSALAFLLLGLGLARALEHLDEARQRIARLEYRELVARPNRNGRRRVTSEEFSKRFNLKVEA